MIGLAIAVVLLVAGLAVGLYGYLTKTVHDVPWGLMISAYVFFALMSAGSTMLNSVYAVFGYEGPRGELKKIIKAGVWFSLVSVAAAATAILLELSYPYRAWAILAFFNPDSRIAWMVAFYGVYGFFLLGELVFLLRSEVSEEALKKLALVKLVLALGVVASALLLYTNLAQVFGTMVSVPAWYGPFMAPLFLVFALYIGAAGQALFMYYYARTSGIESFLSRFYSMALLVATPLLAVLVAWFILTASYNPVAWASVREVVVGSYSTLFWLVQVLVGFVAVFALALAAFRASSFTLLIPAALAALVGGAVFSFWVIVVPQLTLPEVMDGLYRTVEYSVSADEVAVVLGAALLWVSLSALGWQLLPLKAEEKPRRLFFLK